MSVTRTSLSREVARQVVNAALETAEAVQWENRRADDRDAQRGSHTRGAR